MASILKFLTPFPHLTALGESSKIAKTCVNIFVFWNFMLLLKVAAET